MDKFNWKSSATKSDEWAIAKKLLSNDGALPPNGTKLSRHETKLTHSFIVINEMILAMAEQGAYLPRTKEGGKAKMGEDEKGALYVIEIDLVVEPLLQKTTKRYRAYPFNNQYKNYSLERSAFSAISKAISKL